MAAAAVGEFWGPEERGLRGGPAEFWGAVNDTVAYGAAAADHGAVAVHWCQSWPGPVPHASRVRKLHDSCHECQ